MAKAQIFLRGPRYLRAIPSLVLLTTAMAWGVASDPDVRDASGRKVGVSLSQQAVSAPHKTSANGDPYSWSLLPRQ